MGEEVVEEPEEVETAIEKPKIAGDYQLPAALTQPDDGRTEKHKIIRRRIIKKIIYVNGEPVETEEVVEEPEEEENAKEIPKDTTDSWLSSSLTQPDKETPETERVIRQRVIKKVIYINGKPVETEEVVEEPEEVETALEKPKDAEDYQLPAGLTHPNDGRSEIHKIIRRRIIKKVIYVNGEPVETEEVVEDPEEKEIATEMPKDSEDYQLTVSLAQPDKETTE